ncbi:hypothetical protein FQA39_LY11212 [Lamprigera yunnana]|nr:hypothetical protein FQA39_LY11212 [Lamprigera yunnana]
MEELSAQEFSSTVAEGIPADNPHLVLLFFMSQLFLRELTKCHRLVQIIPMDMSGYYDNRAGPSNIGNVISQILLCKQITPDFNQEELCSITKDSQEISKLLKELQEFMPKQENNLGYLSLLFLEEIAHEKVNTLMRKREIMKPTSSTTSSTKKILTNENNENHNETLEKSGVLKRKSTGTGNVDKKKFKSTFSSMLQNSKELKKKKRKSMKDMNNDSDIDIEASIKYGTRVPSIKYIMEYKKNFEEEKRQMEELRKGVNFMTEEELIDFSSICEELKPLTETLNCKHLTISDLKKALKQNDKFLYDIYYGISYCERHELFYKNCVASRLSSNVSMIAFTYPQLKVFLNFFDKKFDNSLGKISYYFQVLLPELCIKVFMDTHKMTYEEAFEYLSKPH